jgi:GTP-binding protein EngB required for normal cell division
MMQHFGSGDDRLHEVIGLARSLDAPEIAAEAEMLGERLAGARFYVACVGQFKRGKSTLLNALIGQSLLPSGIVPVTTAITVLRHGAHVGARVRIGSEWQTIEVGAIASYVSEEHNPANVKRVSIVEVFVPSTLLASGMCLVDTPGIGSVIAENTEATRAFVPQIDAALIVLGADPPISGDELTLVEALAQQVGHLIVVLSKADRLSAAERAEAIAFTRKVLRERLKAFTGPIYEISATERLESGERTRDWPALEETLMRLGGTGGADLLRAAEDRGTRLLAQRLLSELDEQRAALLRPSEESERRIAALSSCVAEAEQAFNDLGHLFGAEQERLHRIFEGHLKRFLAAAIPTVDAELRRQLAGLSGSRSALREQAIVIAQRIATECVNRWLAETAPAAEDLYRQAAERFARLTNDFLQRLSATDEVFSGLPREVHPELGFRTASRLHYTSMMHLTGRSPLRWMLQGLLPPALARRSIEVDTGAYLHRLVETNASRVLGDLDERVLESRRRMEKEIRSYLRLVCESAQRALDRAKAHWAAGHGAVEAELQRLDALRQRVRQLTGDGSAAASGSAAATSHRND